jgi:hypothetical protein
MKDTKNCRVIKYDRDLNKVRCPICDQAVHGALDLKDDYETYDYEWDWKPCPHLLFCEVFGYGLEYEAKRFESIKSILQPDGLNGESYASLFIESTNIKGSIVLSIEDRYPTSSGFDIFYTFVPTVSMV